ncbi:hypothetical protein T484DRAFT_1745702 [Baffinella frigidus]|nr:hypothetical protein T484DRAFT_1745702 [Cryptophyta sp. CCMP2293]
MSSKPTISSIEKYALETRLVFVTKRDVPDAETLNGILSDPNNIVVVKGADKRWAVYTFELEEDGYRRMPKRWQNDDFPFLQDIDMVQTDAMDVHGDNRHYLVIGAYAKDGIVTPGMYNGGAILLSMVDEQVAVSNHSEPYTAQISHRSGRHGSSVPTSERQTESRDSGAKGSDGNRSRGSGANRSGKPRISSTNQDGDALVLDHDSNTYYCGKPKPKTCFVLTNSTPDFPVCGPDEGVQCIACKMAQDRVDIGPIWQGNCDKKFSEKFQQWFPAGDVPVVRSPDDVDRHGIVLSICNGKLNENQATKVIMATALEILLAQTRKTECKYTVHSITSPKITHCPDGVAGLDKSESTVLVNLKHSGGESESSLDSDDDESDSYFDGNLGLSIICRSVHEKGRKSVTGHTHRNRRYTTCILMLSKVCFGMDGDYTAGPALQPAGLVPPATNKGKSVTCKHVFDDGPRKGQVCGATHTRSNGLKRHDESAHQKKTYVCDHIFADGPRKGEKCGITCTTTGNLKKHIDAQHNNKTHDCKHVFEDGPREGETCGKPFGTKQELGHHMMDHTGEVPFHCELLKEDGTVCGEGCKSSAHMNKHILFNHTDKDSQEYKDHRKSENQRGQKKRTKDKEDQAAFIEKNGGTPSAFGHIEGVSRDEEIKSRVVQMMESPAGFLLGPSGAMTVAKWKNRHGDVSLRVVFMNHVGKRFAVYFFITKRDITSGVEVKCQESTVVLHCIMRNPLWRINDNGDLRRFTQAEAGSVCETFLLAIADNHTDITALESGAQRYLQEIGMPHGVRLHKKVGAGSRVPGSKTVYEKKDDEAGRPIIYKLSMTLVEIHDPVFADEADPNDPTPTIPRLLSATVIGRNKKGFPKTFEIEVCGHGQSFRDTPSVLKDKVEMKRLEKQKYKAEKVRHTGRKSVKNQGMNQDCVQEPPTKKQKTAATQLVP